MALTQAFKQTVRARVQRDGKYREALFTGVNALLGSEQGPQERGDYYRPEAVVRWLVTLHKLQAEARQLHAVVSPL